MTILRIQFAGEIKKAESKNVGGKSMVELSLCRKHKGRNGGEDTFSWLRVSVWEPAEFQVPKLVKGAFVAGSGDFQLRSYQDKDGKDRVSAECRSTSFDIEVSDGQQRSPQAATAQPGAGGPITGDPPFQRLSEWG